MAGDATVRIPFADRAGIALEGAFIEADGRIVGLHLHHPYGELDAGRWPKCGGGGYVAWEARPDDPHWQARHQLVAGGPDDLEHLTLSPSLWHRAKDQTDPANPQHGDGSRCSPHRECHGFVRDGKWHVA